jgi:hypothetical protein
MNSHIEHELPIAVVEICDALGQEPVGLHPDYEAVNYVLAEVVVGPTVISRRARPPGG